MKIALQGFDKLKMFPVTKDDLTGYGVGDGFAVTGAREMTKENDVSEQKFYADDGLYLQLKQFNAVNTKITVLEMPLDTMVKLGFGRIDEGTGEFFADPQGRNQSFALTFRCLNTGGDYRQYKFFNFTVTEIKEPAAKTKGKDAQIGEFEILGYFIKRKVDGELYAVKDGVAVGDNAWLDDVESVGE